uniref:Uncharacterized protein n=1 Tax=Mantoniella antarctica TaxID=81844 RepID=A0A7S0T1Y9_9CHLO
MTQKHTPTALSHEARVTVLERAPNRRCAPSLYAPSERRTGQMMATPAGQSKLTPEEVKDELAHLTALAGVSLRPEVFDVLLELTRLNVVPTAIAQVLKSLCTKSQSRASMGAASTGGTFVSAGTAQQQTSLGGGVR